MRRFHEAEEEAEETEEALVVSKRSGKKKDDDDDDDFQQNNNNLLLLPCWRAVARKLRVASARDAQKEVLRRAGWETCVLSCCSPPQYNVSCDDAHVSRRRKARAFSLSLSLSLSRAKARCCCCCCVFFDRRFDVSLFCLRAPNEHAGTREAF